MATQTKFFFTGQDNTKKAFDSINKSMKQAAKQAVVLTTAMNAMGAAVKAAASVITSVLGAAFRGIISLIKGALNTIKALITGTFKFIKTALTTLLSWIKKALGKVFDWISSTIKNIFNGIVKLSQSAINAAKRALDVIIQSVKDYAAKEYNEIQLKVSLGDSFNAVMKDFKELLRYTTADKNDLLSVYATFAELGKKPAEVLKYARATVYLSNATGKSLAQIQRLLLGQEAAEKDIETVLHRIGIDISEQESSLSNVEKIINQLDSEMQELANSSLSQMFANVKNDLITIREQIGSLFSGPVKYVTQKLDNLLKKIIGSNKIENLTAAMNSLFEKIQPTIDKVFEFLEKFVQDPGGFFKALWADIQTILGNIWKNLDKYASAVGVILGHAISDIVNAIKSFDWSSVSGVFDNLAGALKSFTANVGVSLNWWTQEEVDQAEGSITKLIMNAWNKAHPDFELSTEDKWYKNLWTLVKAAWELALKPFWNEFIKPNILDPLKDWWERTWPDIRDTLVETFKYVGSVLGVALNNALVSSEAFRTIVNLIPGMDYVVLADAQERIFEEMKDLLPRGFKASDITRDFLMSSYDKNKNWLYYLMQNDKDNSLQKDLLAFRKNQLLETKEYPSFEEFSNAVKNIWNPIEETTTEINGAIVDASRSFREIDSTVEDIAKSIGTGGSGFVMTAGAGGSGGILDYFSTSGEFKIKPYAKGGLITEPTVALMGEDGPEYVVPNNQLGSFWTDPWKNAMKEAGVTDSLKLIDENTSELVSWWNKTDGFEDVGEETQEEIEEKRIPWYKKIWDATKTLGKGLGYYVGKTASVLAQNGAFGSHIGNIASGIKSQLDNNTLTLWSALGEIIKEFLPYLQKGLEVVGGLFDQAFEIAGNAVQILGERIGKMLLPLLEAFIPLMKTISDVVIALSPVIESVLAPAIKIIALILNIITGLLDKLMPIIAAFSAVIQWVSDAISYAIGSVINWLASWIPWIQSTSVTKPKHVADYYWDIMDTYNAQKANGVSVGTSSTSVASQTATYSGSNHIYITNDFSGSYVVGNGGFRELALIIRNTMEDLDYSGQSV